MREHAANHSIVGGRVKGAAEISCVLLVTNPPQMSASQPDASVVSTQTIKILVIKNMPSTGMREYPVVNIQKYMKRAQARDC